MKTSSKNSDRNVNIKNGRERFRKRPRFIRFFYITKKNTDGKWNVCKKERQTEKIRRFFFKEIFSF